MLECADQSAQLGLDADELRTELLHAGIEVRVVLLRHDRVHTASKVAEAEPDHCEVLHRPVVNVERKPGEAPLQRLRGVGILG